jgi:hypothetical protein
MTRTEFDTYVDGLMADRQIEHVLELARQLRANARAGEPLTDVDSMRADAAQLLSRAADLLGAARAEETRA